MLDLDHRTILVGVPKYPIKFSIMDSQISGAVADFKGTATIKLENSHIITKM